jgi:hypothetical protein
MRSTIASGGSVEDVYLQTESTDFESDEEGIASVLLRV